MNIRHAAAILAIAKNTKLVAEARSAFGHDGEHDPQTVEVLLHVSGSVSVAKDTTTTPAAAKAVAAAIPWEAIALEALHMLSAPCRRLVLHRVRHCATAVDQGAVKSGLQAEVDTWREEAAVRVEGVLPVVRAGAVRVISACEMVD